jgi:hypothetical protein
MRFVFDRHDSQDLLQLPLEYLIDRTKWLTLKIGERGDVLEARLKLWP